MKWNYTSGLDLLSTLDSFGASSHSLSFDEKARLHEDLSDYISSVKLIEKPSSIKEVYSNELLRSLKKRKFYMDENFTLVDASVDDVLLFSDVPLDYLKNLPEWFKNAKSKLTNFSSNPNHQFSISDHLLLEDKQKNIAKHDLSIFEKIIKSRLTKISSWGKYLDKTGFDFSFGIEPFHSPITNSFVFPLNELVTLKELGSRDLEFNLENALYFTSFEVGHALMYIASKDNFSLPNFLKKNPILLNLNYSSPFKESVADFYSKEFFDVLENDSRALRKLNILNGDFFLVKQRSFQRALLDRYKMNFLSYSFYLASSHSENISDEEKQELLASLALSNSPLSFSLKDLRSYSEDSNFFKSKDEFYHSRKMILQNLPYVSHVVQDIHKKYFSENDIASKDSVTKFHDFVLSNGYLSVEGFKELANIKLFK